MAYLVDLKSWKSGFESNCLSDVSGSIQETTPIAERGRWFTPPVSLRQTATRDPFGLRVQVLASRVKPHYVVGKDTEGAGYLDNAALVAGVPSSDDGDAPAIDSERPFEVLL